jgi:NADPH-dependent 2,4-dienoyl-CoA reductase/sulfur reductase-like enzyme
MSASPDPKPIHSCDVTVLGAGPAGAAAAIEAAALGLRVVLLDEQAIAGGQVYRAVPGIRPAHADRDRAEGDRLRKGLADANVDRCFGHRVWHVERVGKEWQVHALGPDGPRTVHSAALIVATGAQERHVPFAGWERPGVIGLAAATILLKAQRILPGRNVVVAGTGPLLLVAAKAIVEGGGRVAAIVDANPRSAWFAHAADLLSRPDLLARGIGWVRKLRSDGVPILHGYLLRAVEGDVPSLRATAVPVDRAGHARAGAAMAEFACDAVCCGFGLMPATDVTRLAGASHAYDPARGGWHVIVDVDQRCDVPGLYAAGDGAGVVGAAAAPLQGRIAALAAARDLGRIDARTRGARAAKRALARTARFGLAMTQIANVGNGTVASIPADVIVCGCERLARAALDEAIDDGCATINDLKAATRCGMGSCGGRLCEDTAARLIALRTGRTRADIGQATGRPPLRPVDLDALAGGFDYDALPMATPAPL